MPTPKYHLDAPFDPADAPHGSHALAMGLVPQGARVLELGCASGYLSGYLTQAKGCTVTGVERDPDAAARAAAHCARVIQGDLEAPAVLAQIDGAFGVLLALNVLEHLQQPGAVLRALHAHLLPGAALIVALPNVAHWRTRWMLLRGRWDYTDYGIMDRTHLRFYTLRTGRALIESSGYRVAAVFAAGSLVQNLVNRAARALGRQPAPPLLPGLLAYELVYHARLSP